jgi:hypothetical protein
MKDSMRSIFRLPGAVTSVWTQVRAALVVGLPSEDESRAIEEPTAQDSLDSLRAIRSMDDYAGYLTSNGLGSLDIGGGSSRWGK